MKLYATTTSERASKGQGGNKYIIIEVLNENQNELLSLYVKEKGDGLVHITLTRPKPTTKELEVLWQGYTRAKEKGKSQKGEHKHDKNCYMQCMSKLVK